MERGIVCEKVGTEVVPIEDQFNTGVGPMDFNKEGLSPCSDCVAEV